jgi:hypothetical protein
MLSGVWGWDSSLNVAGGIFQSDRRGWTKSMPAAVFVTSVLIRGALPSLETLQAGQAHQGALQGQARGLPVAYPDGSR